MSNDAQRPGLPPIVGRFTSAKLMTGLPYPGVRPNVAGSARRAPFYAYFVDDSGDSAMAVAGGLRVGFRAWEAAAADWRALRDAAAADPRTGLGGGDQLHAVELGSHKGWNQKEWLVRRDVIRQGLVTISAMRGVTPWATALLGATREELYAELVARLEAHHAAEGTRALLFVDGNGTERQLRAAHTRLMSRHLADPAFIPARENPLLQAADFVAHTYYQFRAAKPGREEVAGWFPRYLPGAYDPLAD